MNWLRRRAWRLVDELGELLDTDACPNCDAGYVTVPDPWSGEDRIDICPRCDGTGRRNPE